MKVEEQELIASLNKFLSFGKDYTDMLIIILYM